MPHYRITLAYDGTDFEGWQLQGRGGTVRTVQGVVEQALARLGGGGRVAVVAAGRTDTGVHALGQVASFELPRGMAPPDLLRALNGLLPRDVRVLEAAPAPEGFHARRSARSKQYRYVLDTGPVQLPTRRRFAGHVPFRLDRSRVEEAAALYLGQRDFASLASAGGSVRTTVRTVTRSEPGWEEGTLTYVVEADGFLRRMVRGLVGGLVAVGRGAASVDDLAGALLACDRRVWPPPAPACGLTLVRVEYPEPGGGVLR
jgi:tRNA pseudouridine38-40 synthase